MKIYTRAGDGGETGTLGAERVPKDHVRISACGSLDELNATIGCALSLPVAEELASILKRVQRELFLLGAMTAQTDNRAVSSIPQITPEHISKLEGEIDSLEQSLPKLTHFILPGGDPAAATLHLARTVCRRAERSLVTLSRESELPEICLGYTNRLSDLLFVMARYQNQHAGRTDIIWEK